MSNKNVAIRSVFVSSPSELKSERDTVERVIEDVARYPQFSQLYSLRCFRYEDRTPPLVGWDSPQEIVNYFTANVADADILVCILGDRLGSPLIDTKSVPGQRFEYASGTAYELEQALGLPVEQRPDILLYRRSARPESDLSSRRKVDDYLRWLFRNVSEEERKSLELQFGRSTQVYEGLFEHAEFMDASDLHRRFTRDLVQILSRDYSDQSPASKSHKPTETTRVQDSIGQIWTTNQSGLNVIPTKIELESNTEDASPSLTVADAREFARQIPRLKKVFLVGQPDAGKSFILENALLDLLNIGTTFPTQQVPVIVNLSSWTPGQPFLRWLVGELDRFYGIQARLSKKMILGNQFLYFFDGLDEVGATGDDGDRSPAAVLDMQIDCLNSLRSFLSSFYNEEYRLVISARLSTLELISKQRTIDSYFEGMKLATVQPLDQQQIDAFLNVPVNYELAQLRDRISSDDVIARLARIPYMLAAMAAVYRPDGTGFIDWGGARDQERRVAHVIAKIQNRRFSELSLQPNEIAVFQKVLGWASQQVVRTHLLVELLGPRDLKPVHRNHYRLIGSLFLATFIGSVSAIAIGASSVVEWTVLGGSSLDDISLLRGFKHGMMNASCSLLLGTGLAWPVFAFCRGKWFGVAIVFVFSVIRGLMVAVTPEYTDGSMPSGVEDAAKTTLVTFALLVVPFWLYAMRESFNIMEIRPLSSFSWRAGRILIPLFICFLVGLGFLFFASLARGIAFGIVGAAILGTYSAMARTGIQVPPQPNWGIIRSFQTARNTSVYLTALATIIIPLGYYFDSSFDQRVFTSLVNMALSSTVLFTFLLFGGIPVLQHAALRCVLSYHQYTPLNLTKILNLAVRVGPLRRVGGAYSFRADVVRKFYADMHEQQYSRNS